jgi:hypothetical protein
MKIAGRLSEKMKAMPQVVMNKIGVAKDEVVRKQFELKWKETVCKVFVGVILLEASHANPTAPKCGCTPN